MTFLSEDPTYLAAALGLVAAASLMALRVTQQGKYLYWTLGSLGLAGLVLVIEHFWVTDNERIERVVYDLRRAVLASDVEGVLKNLTPDVEYVQNGTAISGETTRTLIRANLAQATFDFIHINDLQTSAGQQTRRGKAEFRVYAKGALQTPLASYNVGTANSTWSLGFEETEPKVWKVNRITPMSLPDGTITVPHTAPRRGGQGRAPRPGRGEISYPSTGVDQRYYTRGALFRIEHQAPPLARNASAVEGGKEPG
jgi:hypothetical protein